MPTVNELASQRRIATRKANVAARKFAAFKQLYEIFEVERIRYSDAVKKVSGNFFMENQWVERTYNEKIKQMKFVVKTLDAAKNQENGTFDKMVLTLVDKLFLKKEWILELYEMGKSDNSNQANTVDSDVHPNQLPLFKG